MIKGTILYVGGFKLPDKNAAAHRVVNNAKIFRELGYNVVFINNVERGNNVVSEKTTYYGFDCYEIPQKMSRKLINIDDVIKVSRNLNDLKYVIAYNFPAISLNMLNNFCKREGIKCLADVTEWYGYSGQGILYDGIKRLDTFLRMRYVHKKMDGIIVISNYLLEYYKKSAPTIKLPPLVDGADRKWKRENDNSKNGLVFVYAGSPSKEKEKLGDIVNAVQAISSNVPIIFRIIGVSEEEFLSIYNMSKDEINISSGCKIEFLGRVTHIEAINHVKQADYSVIIRDKNRVTQAGFPTKFVESISCGTPVITNDNSDLFEYLNDGDNGLMVSTSDLRNNLEEIVAMQRNIVVHRDTFDYKNYIHDTREFLKRIR